MGPSRPGCSTPRSWHHRDRRRVRSSATSGRSYRSAAMSRADIRPGTHATKTSLNRLRAARNSRLRASARHWHGRVGVGAITWASCQSGPGRAFQPAGVAGGAGAPPATGVSGTAARYALAAGRRDGLVAEVGCLLPGVEEAVQRVAVVDVQQQPPDSDGDLAVPGAC